MWSVSVAQLTVIYLFCRQPPRLCGILWASSCAQRHENNPVRVVRMLGFYQDAVLHVRFKSSGPT